MVSACRRLPLALVDALLGWLALWQVLALACVFGGAPFEVLWPLGFVALAGLGMPLLTRPWEGGAPVVAAPVDVRRGGGALVAALGFVAAFEAGLPLWAVALGVAPLAWVYADPRGRVGLPADLDARWFDGLAILGVGVAAAWVTTTLRRADVDDGYYLNAVIQTLEQANRPVLGFDGIHGVPGAPIQQVIHRPQTFEPLVAWLSRASDTPPRDMYWLWLPAAVASGVGLAQWALARVLAPRVAWLAVCLGFGALLAWGDGAQTIARFGFPRLFQGKSVFVTVLAPLVAYAALRYVGAPSWRSLLRLVAAQLAATVFTSTALVVVPIATGLGVLAGWSLDRGALRRLGAGWAAVLPVVAVLGITWWELRQAGGLASDGHEMGSTTALGSARAALVLGGLAATPWWQGGRDGATWVARFVGVALLVLLNGAAPSWLGDGVAELLNWRTFWSVPFVVLLGVGVASGLEASVRGTGGWEDRVRGLLAVAFVVAFLAPGRWAVVGEGTGWNFGAPKTLDRYERIADSVMERVGPRAQVAAPPLVAQALAMRERKPRLVAVWIRYVKNLTRFWGREVSDDRLDVLSFARGKTAPVPGGALDRLCVELIVVDPRRDAPERAPDLTARGFARVARVEGMELWQRDRLPAACGED